MTNNHISRKRTFRPAVFPIFSIFFVVLLVTAIILCISTPDTPIVDNIEFLLPLVITVSMIATFFVWRFTAEVVSTDGVEIFTFLGRRRVLWEQVVEVRTFPSLKLVYICFSLKSNRFSRVLFFQRQTGELREMIVDMVSKDSFVWRQLESA